jgi:hypothetical protein
MLSKFFLKRPVFAWVIAIIMMAAGELAIYNLPISQYPLMAPPSIAIVSPYPGSSAETVENSVTQLIEQKMTGLENMIYMSFPAIRQADRASNLLLRREQILILRGHRYKTNFNPPCPAFPML